jgi:hypothetical protein
LALPHREPWYRINPTSRIVSEWNGFTIVETGGWFDVYLMHWHVTGAMQLEKLSQFMP